MLIGGGDVTVTPADAHNVLVVHRDLLTCSSRMKPRSLNDALVLLLLTHARR